MIRDGVITNINQHTNIHDIITHIDAIYDDGVEITYNNEDDIQDVMLRMAEQDHYQTRLYKT